MKRYTKDGDISYSLGVFPTIELLQKRPQDVLIVVLHSKGEKNSGVAKIKDLCKKHRIPCEVKDRDIRMFAYKENTYAIGIFKKYETEIDKTQNHVVLVGLRNMGNLGTIMRTMVAFGVLDVAIIRPSADIFDPKVISSAMGAFFQVRFNYYDSLSQYIESLSFSGVGKAVDKPAKRQLYTFVVDGVTDIREMKFEEPFSLVFGSESAGLTQTDAKLGKKVSIPQFGDVDSLNLSIAVGIGLYSATALK